MVSGRRRPGVAAYRHRLSSTWAGGRYPGMTETEIPVPPVGPDQAPEPEDTSPRPEDGPQDVDQDPGYEEAETDEPENDDDDPEVHEVA